MLDTVRGLVRPLVTTAVVAVWSFLVITGRAEVSEYVVMAAGALAYWFAGRTPPSNGAHP